MTSRSTQEHALVIGASITGLTAALALNARGFEVTIIEADAAPEPSINFETSSSWRRRGVPHAPQPHFFLGKLRQIIRDWYPDLLRDLRAAGIPEMDFNSYLHPVARDGYKPAPGDEDLAILAARRSTMELAMRRHIIDHDVATLLTSTTVRGLILEGDAAPFTVRGVRVEKDKIGMEIQADVVIDGAGRSSPAPQYLRKAGIECPEEVYASPSAYYTRLYRLLPGKLQPELGGMPASMYGDFAIATFPADHGYFTVTLVVYKDDPILFGPQLQQVDVFEAVCNSTRRGKIWIDPNLSKPVGDVSCWANMDFLWRSTTKNCVPQVLNFFFAGDSAIRSNPKYGRGCTWSALGTHLLAEALVQTRDPTERVRLYESKLRTTFRKEWETLLQIDRQDTERFKYIAGLNKGALGDRFYSALQNHLGTGAMLVDSNVARKLIRGYFGLEAPSRWMRSPLTWLRIVAALRPSRAKAVVIAENNRRPSRQELAAAVTGALR